MRVISGSLGGRSFDSPHSKLTHPMSDKVRGALFNALGDINGLTILDVYAGSGALSLEAISRGANSAIAIDNDLSAYKTTVGNIKALALEAKITPLRATIKSWSNRHPNNLFDIVLCDPPYDDIRRDHLQKLARHTKPGGVVVFSLPSGANAELDESEFKPVSSKSYGDANLVFYKRTG